MEKICQLKDVFICDPNHRCTAVQPFCLSVMYGKAILVRWEKIAENMPKENLHYTCKRGEGPQSLCWERQVEIPATLILERPLPLKAWRTWGRRGSPVVRALGRPWNGDLHQFSCSWVCVQDHLTCSPAVAFTHCWCILDSCHLWIGSSAWKEAAGMLGGHGFLWVPILVVPLTLQKVSLLLNQANIV